MQSEEWTQGSIVRGTKVHSCANVINISQHFINSDLSLLSHVRAFWALKRWSHLCPSLLPVQ